MRQSLPRLAVALLLIAAAALFLTGINWGLPSPAADPFLFGNRPAWTGKQIVDLAGGWEDNAAIGADVAHNPLAGRDRVLLLNDTDAKRAEIVRRYRLFSYQPDEMITLRALAGMKPSKLQLDPKLYQYGGLWVYPVGGLLQIASSLHLVQLRGDVTYYLDHPAEFGRFYIVARFYTVLWALFGVIVVFAIVRRIMGEWIFPTTAAACFMVMPVVMNMAHEAKPHLPGAVLMLLATYTGSLYVESGACRWSLITGALCGAAIAMVLSSVPVLAILPVMVLLRPSRLGEKSAVAAASAVAAGAVYLLTNPYIPINLLFNRAVLQSNFGNSRAFYHAELTASGIGNALKLIALGTAPLLAIAGLIGAFLLAIRAVKLRNDPSLPELRRRSLGLLLAAPAVWVAGQCILFATGKPGEFGRFAILPDIFLMIEAVVAIGTFVKRPAIAALLLSLLWITTAIPGMLYLRGFVRDSRAQTPRLALARSLRDLEAQGQEALWLNAEPAPYCLPPVDLWRWKLLLLPRGDTTGQFLRAGTGFWVRTVDVPPDDGVPGLLVGTPISWANKPFEIQVGKTGAAR